MSIHLSYIAGMAAKPLASIQNEMRKASHTSIPDNIYQLSNRITGVVRELSVINGKEVNIHRIFVHTGDSGAYETVGWVLACDVKHCMICSTSFGYFTYQYYCIACGNIVCQKCSVNEALVFEIRHLGLKRVCDQCYWGQEVVYALHRSGLATVTAEATTATMEEADSVFAPPEGEQAQSPEQSVDEESFESVVEVGELTGCDGGGRIDEEEDPLALLRQSEDRYHQYLVELGAAETDSDEVTADRSRHRSESYSNDGRSSTGGLFSAEAVRRMLSTIGEDGEDESAPCSRSTSVVGVQPSSPAETPVSFRPVMHLQFMAALVAKPWRDIAKEFKLTQARPDCGRGVAPEISESRIIGLTHEVATVHGSPVGIHRVYARCADSGPYAGVGWVVAADVKHCMICFRDLSSKIVRRHCLGCGNIVCGACSDSEAVVFELQSLGPQRVCRQCFWGQELVHGQHGLQLHIGEEASDKKNECLSTTRCVDSGRDDNNDSQPSPESSPFTLVENCIPKTGGNAQSSEPSVHTVEDPDNSKWPVESEETVAEVRDGPSEDSREGDPEAKVKSLPSLTQADRLSTPNKIRRTSSPTPTAALTTPVPRQPLYSKPPKMHGWLRKRGHIVLNWKSRYFVLDNGYLTYYADKLDAPPYGRDMKGQLCLAGYREKELEPASAPESTEAPSPPKKTLGVRRISFRATSSNGLGSSNWSRVEETISAPDGFCEEEAEDSDARRLRRICLVTTSASSANGAIYPQPHGESAPDNHGRIELGRELLLEASNTEERAKWVVAIRAHTLYIEDLLDSESAANALLSTPVPPAEATSADPVASSLPGDKERGDVIAESSGSPPLRPVPAGKLSHIINAYGGGTGTFYKKLQSATGNVGRGLSTEDPFNILDSERLRVFLAHDETLVLWGLATKPNSVGIPLMRELLWIAHGGGARRLVHIDPKSLELKGEIRWPASGPQPRVKLVDGASFEIIDCQKRVYRFVSKDSVSASQWVDTISGAITAISPA